jgi:hypothetical protein
VSSNGRRYTREAFKRAVARKLYEGCPVYADHPQRSGQPRPVAALVGRLSGIYERNGALYARKFHVLKSHPMAEAIYESCERGLPGLGLSHNAAASAWHFADGVQVITELESVESVDLVSQPATNASLWESGAAVGRAPLERAAALAWLAKE